MHLQRIAKNLPRVLRDVSSYASEILAQKHKKELISIQQDQLLSGVRGDGKNTKQYKSDQYVKRNNKQSAKSYPNRNYYLEGDFFDGMDVADEGENVLFYSLDSKSSFLEEEEDNELLGIAPKNIVEVDNIKGFAKELINKVGYELSR